MNYTTTITVRRKQHKSFVRKMLTLAVIGFILFVALVAMVGCTAAAPVANPAASQAAAPVVESPAAEEPMDSGVLVFGETASWDDAISISVSEPVAFKPTEYAAGLEEGQTAVMFEIVLTNNSSEKYEPLIYNTASSAGEEASGVFDVEAGIDFPPTTAVLPGKTIKWKEAYSVADAADITLEVSPGFTYDSVIFTSNK